MIPNGCGRCTWAPSRCSVSTGGQRPGDFAALAEAVGELLAVVGEHFVRDAVWAQRLREREADRPACRPCDDGVEHGEAGVVIASGHDLELGGVDQEQPAPPTMDVQMSACVSMRDGHVASLPFAEAALARADRLRLGPTAAIAAYFAALGRLFAGHADLVEPVLAQARALVPESADTLAQIGDLAGIAAWLDSDPVEALAVFDRNRAGRGHSAAFSTTPMWGLRALLRAALHPADRAGDELRAPEISAQACNEGARHYADAVAAARAGRLAAAAQFFTAGDQVMAGHRTWRHMLRMTLAEPAAREAFGAPERRLRAAYSDVDGTGRGPPAASLPRADALARLPRPRTHRDTPPSGPRCGNWG